MQTADDQTVPIDSSLYNALLSRNSVRRYAQHAVEPEVLERIAAFVPRVAALVPENRFQCEVRPILRGSSELASSLGSYTRIMSAPFMLVPAIGGKRRILEDFGFRVQQIVIELTRMGLGSCWIGALPHEAKARERLNVSAELRLPSVIVFGYAGETTVARAVNSAYRAVTGAPRRLPFEKFVFSGAYGKPARPSERVLPVLDALRNAPSAGNARPWRVILRESVLYYCVDTAAGFYRLYRADYPHLDAGIGMANIWLALSALGTGSEWHLLDDDDSMRGTLGLPESCQLIASIVLPQQLRRQ